MVILWGLSVLLVCFVANFNWKFGVKDKESENCFGKMVAWL
jgi:hypothetical protein